MPISLPRKVYGNAIVLAAALSQKGIAYRDPGDLRRIRDKRIRRIVRFAARTVPFYQDWFSAQKVDPRDIRTADDLAELPILEKSTVSQDPERFRSISRSGHQAVRFTTSGSTGQPLTFYHDRRSILANMGFSQAAQLARAELIGKRFGYRVLGINRSGSTIKHVRDFCNANTLLPSRRQPYRFDVTDPPEMLVDAIRELRPEVLSGYGSYLEMFFRHVQQNRIALPLPRLVHYSADGISAPGRQLITEGLGIPVAGSYAAVECFKIGFECGRGAGYHLHEDLCHTRVINDRGEDLPPGEAGPVIITNLVNRGTVLINYRLGDIASLTDQPCPCGRTLRLLENLEGRIEDMLMMADGRFVHPRAVWAVLRHAQGLLRYQLIQHSINSFELNLVTTSEESYRE